MNRLLPLVDVDILVLGHLRLADWITLRQISRFYRNLVDRHTSYLNLRDYYGRKKLPWGTGLPLKALFLDSLPEDVRVGQYFWTELHLQQTPLDPEEICRAFWSCCLMGNLSSTEWLWKVGPTVPLESNLFKLVCDRGHLALAQWLYEKLTLEPADYQSAFSWACQRGHRAMAGWLQTVYRQPISLSHLSLVCRTGDVAFFQELLDQASALDWSAERAAFFQSACQYGHVEMAKYLYHLFPPPEPSLYCPRGPCFGAHLEVSQWLNELL